MADQKKRNFTVKFYKKEEELDTKDYSFINDNFSFRMSQMSEDIQKHLEKIVVDNGWFTLHAGVFALIYRDEVSLRNPVLMIIYLPTFQYQQITHQRQMQDELGFMGVQNISRLKI